MVPPIATDAHVDALSSDLPRVKDAVKNLAAVVLAELAAAGDAASQSEPTHSARYDAMPTTPRMTTSMATAARAAGLSADTRISDIL